MEKKKLRIFANIKYLFTTKKEGLFRDIMNITGICDYTRTTSELYGYTYQEVTTFVEEIKESNSLPCIIFPGLHETPLIQEFLESGIDFILVLPNKRLKKELKNYCIYTVKENKIERV